MAPTHRGCALVSVTKHHHRQFLSADHFHHGLIGFDRRVAIEWLETVSWKQARGVTSAELRKAGHGLLRSQYPSKVARGKTLTVIFHLWVQVPQKAVVLRNAAACLLKDLDSQRRIALHWGLAVATYPFFRDVADVAGRLISLQRNVSLAQLRRRVLERWGRSSTAERAIQRIVRSWIDWGVLHESDKRGTYTAAAPIKIEGTLGAWLIEALLVGSDLDSIPVGKIKANPVLFPFEIHVLPSDLERAPRLIVQEVVSRRNTARKSHDQSRTEL